MKNLLLKLVLLIPIFGQVSCGEDIADCPNDMCVISGGWKLTKVFIDGVKDTEDLSKYQLLLNAPSPKDALISDFDRTQPSGTQDSGSWSIENAGDILRLIPDNNTLLTEDW